ncbi:fasciclin domain containing protein [Nitzschia inconspicua]|uniref:Fasciclin domain containing protein n=1 Tax=Nitzschia inconspicua TaxID=303405 RepID=A0A9K3PXQ4_9STRA|nr:fasciclin domain containing protein [Nitzschia inconspicua]
MSTTMIKKVKCFLGSAAFGILYSSHKANGQNCSVAGSQPSITDIACSQTEFSTVCTLLNVAGLDGPLDAGGPFTLFLPNNGAFSNLGQDTLDLLTAAESVGILEGVLLDHAVDTDAVILSNDLVCDESIAMLSGEPTTTICTGGEIFQIGQGNLALNQNANLLPKIVEADVLACNGVVHQISNVILRQGVVGLVSSSNEDEDTDDDPESPVTEPGCTPNIVDLACEDNSLSTLCAALRATQLDGILNQAGPFTVFAPNDDAFLAIGENTVAALLEEDVGLESLKDILLCHVVRNEVILSDDLVCLGESQMANGGFTRRLCHSRSGRRFQIGYGNSYRNYPEIVVPDITDACNGVIHVIDGLILPKPASYRSSGRAEKSGKSDHGNQKTKFKNVKNEKSTQGKQTKQVKRTKW